MKTRILFYCAALSLILVARVSAADSNRGFAREAAATPSGSAEAPTKAGGSGISGLCPASYPDLDQMVTKANVTPKDLKSLHLGDASKEEIANLYSCLSHVAPSHVEKNTASQDEKEKALENLRKLTGFMNNIPSGSRNEAGLELNPDNLKQYADKIYPQQADFNSRFSTFNPVGASR